MGLINYLFFTLLLALVFGTSEGVVGGQKPSGAAVGYSLQCVLGLPKEEFEDFKHLATFCMEQETCKLIEMALEQCPLPPAEESLLPEFQAPEEQAEPEQKAMGSDSGRTRRLLPGLPDKHNWANGGTRHCANEGGWCSCTGNVVYTKKCAGTFGCNQADWGKVVSSRWNSNHRSNVNGGIHCNNGNFGGDPWSGHDKQCFCHPKEYALTPYQYVEKWTEAACLQTCGGFWGGLFCGFMCTGGCTAQAMAFASGRSHTFPAGSCYEFCYCVGNGWTG